jgi:hypothetical protein
MLLGHSRFIEKESLVIFLVLKKVSFHWPMQGRVAVIPTQWIQSVIPATPEALRIYKRRSYLKHKRHLAELDRVFQALAAQGRPIPRGGIPMMATTTGIPVSTLRSWKSLLAGNPLWRPMTAAYWLAR